MMGWEDEKRRGLGVVVKGQSWGLYRGVWVIVIKLFVLLRVDGGLRFNCMNYFFLLNFEDKFGREVGVFLCFMLINQDERVGILFQFFYGKGVGRVFRFFLKFRIFRRSYVFFGQQVGKDLFYNWFVFFFQISGYWVVFLILGQFIYIYILNLCFVGIYLFIVGIFRKAVGGVVWFRSLFGFFFVQFWRSCIFSFLFSGWCLYVDSSIEG